MYIFLLHLCQDCKFPSSTTLFPFLPHQFLLYLNLAPINLSQLFRTHSTNSQIPKLWNKMSSQNQGRQSPDPERESSAQKAALSSGQGVNDSSNNKDLSRSQLEVRHWASMPLLHNKYPNPNTTDA